MQSCHGNFIVGRFRIFCRLLFNDHKCTSVCEESCHLLAAVGQCEIIMIPCFLITMNTKRKHNRNYLLSSLKRIVTS